jgi:hypothetical protein
MMESQRSRRGRAEPALAARAMVVLCAAVGCQAPRTEPSPGQVRQGLSATACGHSGEPDCPTQRWMKDNMQAPFRKADFARLERAYQELVDTAPVGYDSWPELARSGLEAARAKNGPALGANCKHCHDDHRTRFRGELRASVVWHDVSATSSVIETSAP